MTIKPTRDNVLLIPIPPVLQSTDGIILIEKYQDDRMQWIVESVGPKVKEVVPGDRVLTPLHFDHLTLDDGRKIVSESQLLMAWVPEVTGTLVGPRTCEEEQSL